MDEDAKLGELLTHENLLTESQLKTAQDFQKSLGGDLRDILVKLGFVKDSVIASLIAASEHMHTIDISDKEVDAELMDQIPRALLERHQVVPLKGASGQVILAMSDPNDYAAVEEIQFLTSRRVETALAPRAAVRKAINQHYEQKAQQRQQPPSGAAVVAEARLSVEQLKQLQAIPTDALLRSVVLTLIEHGKFSADEIIARATGPLAPAREPARGR